MNTLITARGFPHAITARCTIYCLDGLLPTLTMNRLRYELRHETAGDLAMLYRTGALAAMPGLGHGGLARVHDILAAAALIDNNGTPGGGSHLLTARCPMHCLAGTIPSEPMSRLSLDLPHGTIADVISLYRQGILTQIRGLDPAHLTRLQAALAAAKLIQDAEKPGRTTNRSQPG